MDNGKIQEILIFLTECDAITGADGKIALTPSPKHENESGYEGTFGRADFLRNNSIHQSNV